MPARIAYKALYAGQHISMIPMRHAHVLSSISFLGGQSMITSCMAFFPALTLQKPRCFIPKWSACARSSPRIPSVFSTPSRDILPLSPMGTGKSPANTCACRSIAPTGRASMRNTSASAHSAFSRRAPLRSIHPNRSIRSFWRIRTVTRWNSRKSMDSSLHSGELHLL